MTWWWRTQKPFFGFLLLPLMWLYQIVIFIRRKCYQWGIFSSYRAPVPVIVIGNLTLGGNGKTPFTMALVAYLKQHGFKPGIVSRGYGGRAKQYPMNVLLDSDVNETGDEALLLKHECHCPVYVDPKRPRAIQTMLKFEDLDVVVCDDGLQHYALQRDIEVVMVDSTRMFGNKYCLPLGPLRESLSRLKAVDYIVTTGDVIPELSPYTMNLDLSEFINCKNTNLRYQNTKFPYKKFPVIAGIGNPQRFFESLSAQGFDINAYAFPDHYHYKESDLSPFDNETLVMTAKDAVKLNTIANERWWFVSVQIKVSDGLFQAIQQQILTWKPTLV